MGGMDQIPAKFLRDGADASSFEKYNKHINKTISLPRGM